MRGKSGEWFEKNVGFMTRKKLEAGLVKLPKHFIVI